MAKVASNNVVVVDLLFLSRLVRYVVSSCRFCAEPKLLMFVIAFAFFVKPGLVANQAADTICCVYVPIFTPD